MQILALNAPSPQGWEAGWVVGSVVNGGRPRISVNAISKKTLDYPHFSACLRALRRSPLWGDKQLKTNNLQQYGSTQKCGEKIKTYKYSFVLYLRQGL